MGRNEAGVISDFKGALQEYASKLNRHFESFPLGPQDRHVLGDDFWTTYSNFTIVESKWSEAEFKSENEKKERLKRLCEGLKSDRQMAQRHAKCHRIAWRDSSTKRLMSKEYRKVVCYKIFPDTCAGTDCETESMTVDDFADDFFGEPPLHCLPLKEFIAYIEWLTSVVTGAPREITVLARKRDGEGYTISDNLTLDELSKLLPSPNPPTP